MTTAPRADAPDVLDVAVKRLAGVVELSRDQAAQLRYELDTRIVVEQAKGILAERHGLTLEQAFAILRRTSRNTHRRLKDVARDVVAGTRTDGGE